MAFLERPIAFGFFERAEVLALQVFDERNLEELVVRHVHLDARNLREARVQRSAESALPGDDREATVAAGPDQDGFEDAFIDDGLRELGEISHRASGLIRIRLDEVNGDAAPDRKFIRADELVDEVRVVAHARGFGEAAALRHGKESPPSGCSTRARLTNAERR